MSDTPETDTENDLQCELAAWELLAEARRERDEARGKYDIMTTTITSNSIWVAALNEAADIAAKFANEDAAAAKSCSDFDTSMAFVYQRDRSRAIENAIRKVCERNETLEELKPLRQRTPETDDFELNLDDYSHPWKAIEFARKLERERDEARTELEEYRSIAENIGAVKAVSEKEKAICERNEAQEYSKATWQSLRDSQDEVLRLTFENRELTQGIDEALILGNKLADECERILGLGLHQNTTERFKAALEAWKNYNNE